MMADTVNVITEMFHGGNNIFHDSTKKNVRRGMKNKGKT